MNLSRKGWNNVIIFAVFIIIFIFNFSPKLTLSPKSEQRSVISSELLIVEIKTPDFNIKRIGRAWKSEPDLGLSEQQLALLVQNWQQLELEPQATIKNAHPPYVIQIYTAHQAQPIIVQLFQQGDDYLLQIDPALSLSLSGQQLPLLLGR